MKKNRLIFSLLIVLDAFLMYCYFSKRAESNATNYDTNRHYNISTDRATGEGVIDASKQSLAQSSNLTDPTTLYNDDIDYFKTTSAKNAVERTFGAIIDSLNLSREESLKLKELLAKRYISLALASGRGASNPSIDELSITANQVDAYYEQELRANFSFESITRIAHVLSVESELMDVHNKYEAMFAFNGVPLTPSQKLSLATILRDNFTVPQLATGTEAGVTKYRTQGVDKDTGLSSPDRSALDKIAKDFSSDQLGLLKSIFVRDTAKYSLIENRH